MNEQVVFQPSVSSPGVFSLMSVDNRPLLYSHWDPDHRRSPVSTVIYWTHQYILPQTRP